MLPADVIAMTAFRATWTWTDEASERQRRPDHGHQGGIGQKGRPGTYGGGGPSTILSGQPPKYPGGHSSWYTWQTLKSHPVATKPGHT